MSEHHHLYTISNKPTKGIEFERVEAVASERQAWQGFMRIDIGVAMSRKMFGTRNDACVLHPSHVRTTQIGYTFA